MNTINKVIPVAVVDAVASPRHCFSNSKQAVANYHAFHRIGTPISFYYPDAK